jgi:DNA-directed RNA polymerase subunit L
VKDFFEEKIKDAIKFHLEYEDLTLVNEISKEILEIPEIKKALEHWKEMHMLPKGE